MSGRKRNLNRSEDYKADLLAELRNDPVYAAEYLSAAKSDSNEAFLVALRDVAEAQKGMNAVAKAAKVNRENLYRALSKQGNPRLDTLTSVLEAVGMEFSVRLKHHSLPISSGISGLSATTGMTLTSTTIGTAGFMIGLVQSFPELNRERTDNFADRSVFFHTAQFGIGPLVTVANEGQTTCEPDAPAGNSQLALVA